MIMHLIPGLLRLTVEHTITYRGEANLNKSYFKGKDILGIHIFTIKYLLEALIIDCF